MHQNRVLVIFVFLSLLAFNLSLKAKDVPLEVSVDSALRRALKYNPKLQALRKNIAIADGMIFQAGRKPNPELSLGFEDFAGNGELSGTQSLKSSLGLSQKILTANKIGRRVRVEKLKKQIEITKTSFKELQLRKNVLLKFFEAFFLKKLIKIETEYLEILKHNTEAVSKKVEAGESPSIDLTRARVELTTARIEQKTLHRKYQTALLELSTLWGDPSTNLELIFKKAGDLSFEEIIKHDLSAKLEHHPDMLIAALNTSLARAEKKLARSKASPDFEVSAGVERSRGEDNHGYFAEVSVPLFIFDRRRGLIKSAAAEIKKSENLKRQAGLELQKELLQLQKELLSVTEEFENCKNVLLPGSLQALNQMQQAYDEGERELFELFDARRVYLNTRKVYIQIEAEKFRTLIKLAVLTGMEKDIFGLESQGLSEEDSE